MIDLPSFLRHELKLLSKCCVFNVRQYMIYNRSMGVTINSPVKCCMALGYRNKSLSVDKVRATEMYGELPFAK